MSRRGSEANRLTRPSRKGRRSDPGGPLLGACALTLLAPNVVKAILDGRQPMR